MSFKTASAILKGRWLLDRQWAFSHSPIIAGLIKGDATAFKAYMGDDDDDDDDGDDNCTQPQLIAATKNVYGVSCYTDLSKLPAGTIAYVDIDGPLLKQGDWCSFGMEDYAELFYGLMNCQNVDGVILDEDSPGGQVDGTQTFADAVFACASVKPVIGFVDDGMSASASYWTLCACTELYCSQMTDTVGSIGVFCTIADWYGFYESQGLKVKDVYAPGSEDKNLVYRESIAGNDDLLKAELQVIRNAFVADVQKYRKGKINGTDWQTGAMYFPGEAQALGLIDGVKSFDQVVWRISRLIAQKKSQITNSNTMAFEKVLKTANAEAFEVVDNGFVVSEDGLHAINTALTVAETAAADLATANTALTAANNAKTTAEASLAAANTKITTLEEKIVAMGKLDGGRITTPAATTDDNKPPVPVDNAAFKTSFDKHAEELQARMNLK